MKLFRKQSSLKNLTGFSRSEDGAILVEFALVLPVFLLVIATAVVSGHLFWTYQSAISGVRDAGRYLGRVAPIDICATGGTLSGYNATLRNIVERDISGVSIFPSSVTINSVTASLTCHAGTYRTSPAPVATVTANMTINLPMSSVFSLFGSSLSAITISFSDQSRIFGQ
ncbi:MAG: TadE/TadG family type IV pilus assembly protein [Paracoccaceae bacterium]